MHHIFSQMMDKFAIRTTELDVNNQTIFIFAQQVIKFIFNMSLAALLMMEELVYKIKDKFVILQALLV